MKNKRLERYLKSVCYGYNISWEDYISQLHFEVPLSNQKPPTKGFMYADIFIWFLDLPIAKYRQISIDCDLIIQDYKDSKK